MTSLANHPHLHMIEVSRTKGLANDVTEVITPIVLNDDVTSFAYQRGGN